MVSVPSTRRRAIAVLLTTLLLSVTAMPIANAQNGVNEYQLYLNQGEARLVQGGKATAFVSGNESVRLEVPVYNTGNTAATNIPLFWTFHVWNATTFVMDTVPLVDCLQVPTVSPNTNVTAQKSIDPTRIPKAFDVEGAPVNNFTMRLILNREPNVGDPGYTAERQAQLRNACGAPKFEEPTGLLAGATPATPGQFNSFSDWRATDNIAFTSLVRDWRMDLKVAAIKWCRGYDDWSTAPCHDTAVPSSVATPDRDDRRRLTGDGSTRMLNEDGTWYNVTRQWEPAVIDGLRQIETSFDVPNGTFFEVEIENDAINATHHEMRNPGHALCGVLRPDDTDGDGTIDTGDWDDWRNVRLDASRCGGYRFGLDIRLAPEGTPPEEGPISLTNTSNPSHTGRTKWRSKDWNLLNVSGNFSVYANIDPNGLFPETVTTNNDRNVSTIQVRHAEFRANFTDSDFRTSAADPYPYPPGRTITMTGRVQFQNVGNTEPLRFWRDENNVMHVGTRDIKWRVYLDNTSNTYSGSLSALTTHDDKRGPWNLTVTFENNTIPGDPQYITPGKHTLVAEVDHTKLYTEPNETDNVHRLDIFLADDSKPNFLPYLDSGSKPRISEGTLLTGAAITKARPNETFRVSVNVTDDDQPGLWVRAIFTLDDDANTTRTYNLSRPLGHATNYTAIVTGFLFNETNASSQNWTLRVNASDAFGNWRLSDPAKLRLDRWPIHDENASTILLGIPAVVANGTYHPDGTTFVYRDPNKDIRVEIYLRSNMTGITTATRGVEQENFTHNLNLTVSMPNGKTKTYQDWSALTNCLPDRKLIPDGETDCQNLGKFSSVGLNSDTEGGPGRWNLSVEIMDLGGDVKRFNYSFILQDQLPLIENFTLSHSERKPGDDLRIRVNVSDDVDTVNRTFVNFTRLSDNKTLSFPLTKSVATGTRLAYDQNITTGRGNQLDHGGLFDVRIVAEDKQGNWANSTPLTFRLSDTVAPNLRAAGATQRIVEIGENVTFFADVVDETNVSGFLTVRRDGSSEDLFAPVNLTADATGNLTAKINISTEGEYVWTIWATDSQGLTSNTRTGPLSVRANLGPRFELRSPSHSVGLQLYGRAAQPINVLVYDTDGVDNTTIGLRVGNVTVRPDSIVPATEQNGYLVTYVPREPFDHRALVDINVTAIDKSAKSLPSWLNRTFIVDAVTPVPTLVAFEPRFATQQSPATWNVSTTTRFTLAAHDEDGLPTGVSAIRYQVYDGARVSAVNVYTGPFTIADTGIYSGPRSYDVQFWAEDSVGNSGQDQYAHVTVFVDDIAPALDGLGALPQGRYVNATFVDDRSGVDRAVVWYSVNGGVFTLMTMDLDRNAWRAVLPEGKRGDTITYYLQVWDRVNNTATVGSQTEPYSTYVVGNHLPALAITAPAEGSRIARTIDLTWTASDEDGDALTFNVYYRAPGRSSFVELAKLENGNERKYALDTTRFADGEYTFRVTANDGSFVNVAETTVQILNRGSALGTVTPPPGEVGPGEGVLLKVEVTKAQATVEARVYRDGKFVEAYEMNDEGRDGDEVPNDGIYSVRVDFASAGDYSVDFFTRYQEGGELRESSLSDAATFSVKLTTISVFTTYGALLALLLILAVAGAGIAGYVVFGRRRWP